MSPRRAAPQKKQSGLPSWVIPVGIGVAVVAVVLIIAAAASLQTPAPASLTPGDVTASGRTIGNTSSKVAFTEFGDFQ